MSDRLPWYKSFTADQLDAREVRMLSLAGKGLLADLKALQWRAGPLPLDPKDIEVLCGRPDGFDAAWQEVQRCLEETPEGWVYPSLVALRREAERENAGRSEGGKKAMAKRWGEKS